MKKVLNIVERNKASLGIRFSNNLIDCIILFVFNYIAVIISNMIYEATFIKFFYLYSKGGILWDLSIGSINSFLYYFFMENYADGRTVSKYITGTKVISTDGTKPITQQILYRSLIRIIPFDGFSFLGTNGWHDSWSETRVVDLKKYITETQAKSEIDSIGTKEIA